MNCSQVIFRMVIFALTFVSVLSPTEAKKQSTVAQVKLWLKQYAKNKDIQAYWNLQKAGKNKKLRKSAFFNALSNPNPKIRAVAASILRQSLSYSIHMKNRQFVSKLLANTQDPDFNVRLHAIFALAKLAPEKKKGIKDLILFLEKEKIDSIKMRIAIESLGYIGQKAKVAVPTLIKIARGHVNKWMRKEATKALYDIGISENSILRAFSEALQSEPFDDIRSYAARFGSKKRGGKRSNKQIRAHKKYIEAIVTATNDPSWSVVQAALHTLCSVQPKNVDVLPIVKKIVKRDIPALSIEVVGCLQGLPEAKVTTAVGHIFHELLLRNKKQVRKAVLIALDTKTYPEKMLKQMLPVLIRIAQPTPKHRIRDILTNAMQKFEAIQILMVAKLFQVRPIVREFICRALFLHGTTKVLKKLPLTKLSQEPQINARLYATLISLKLGQRISQDIPTIHRFFSKAALSSEEASHVFSALTMYINSRKQCHSAFAHKLGEMTRHPKSKIRLEAVSFVAKLRVCSKQVIPYLAQSILDPHRFQSNDDIILHNHNVSERALLGLASFGTQGHKAIIDQVRKKTGKERNRVLKLLSSLSGQTKPLWKKMEAHCRNKTFPTLAEWCGKTFSKAGM